MPPHFQKANHQDQDHINHHTFSRFMVSLRASPTVWQLGLAFLFFAKNLKFSYPTVWQLGLAFLSTWQTPVVSAHICARSVRLAIDSARYSRTISPPRAKSFPSRAAGFVSRETPGL